jgi:hypothetical protein
LARRYIRFERPQSLRTHSYAPRQPKARRGSTVSLDVLSDICLAQKVRWQLAAINSWLRRSERLPFLCCFHATPRKGRPAIGNEHSPWLSRSNARVRFWHF